MTQTSPETRRLILRDVALPDHANARVRLRELAKQYRSMVAVPSDDLLVVLADADALAALQAKVQRLGSLQSHLEVKMFHEPGHSYSGVLCHWCGAQWKSSDSHPANGCLEVERRSWPKEAYDQAD